MNDLMVQEKEQLSGLTETKAKQLKELFDPMMNNLVEVEKDFNKIVELEMKPETCVLAKRMRLDISKIRISADKVRKDQKAEYLRAGNAIQGIYNIIKLAVVSKEEKLKDIELHYERIEEEKKKQLQIDRQEELLKYESDGEFVDLGNMPDDVWNNYFTGVKNNYEAVKEAERKTEADRIEAERKEAEEREKMRLENERLKVEAEKVEKKRIAEQKKLDKEKAIQEEKLKAEREKAEAEKRIQNEIIKKEREAKIKLEREIEEKEAERLRVEKEKSDRVKAEQKKANNAPDKEKLNKLISYMEDIGKGLKGEEAKNIVREAYLLIKGFSKVL